MVLTGCAGMIHGIEVSTLHFTGNYPPACSIQGAELRDSLTPRIGDRIGTAAPHEEMEEAEKLNSEVKPKSQFLWCLETHTPVCIYHQSQPEIWQ